MCLTIAVGLLSLSFFAGNLLAMINRNGSIVTTYTDIGHFTDQDKLTVGDDGVRFAFGLVEYQYGYYDPYDYLEIQLIEMKTKRTD